MASRIQFKFKSATTSETVLFDGTYISVGDLKREIVEKKGLSKDHAAELLLSEAQTGRGTPARVGKWAAPRVAVSSSWLPRVSTVTLYSSAAHTCRIPVFAHTSRRVSLVRVPTPALCRVDRRQRADPKEHQHHRPPRPRRASEALDRTRREAGWVRTHTHWRVQHTTYYWSPLHRHRAAPEKKERVIAVRHTYQPGGCVPWLPHHVCDVQWSLTRQRPLVHPSFGRPRQLPPQQVTPAAPTTALLRQQVRVGTDTWGKTHAYHIGVAMID